MIIVNIKLKKEKEMLLVWLESLVDLINIQRVLKGYVGIMRVN